MKTATRLIHTLGSPDVRTGSVVPPVHNSTIFAMDRPTSDLGFQYGRINNPTREILEKTLADLEGGRFAAAFSSGSAALSAVFSLVHQGEKILCHTEMYEGTGRILQNMKKEKCVKLKQVDFTKTEEIIRELQQKTKLILFETPTNPSLITLNIRSISRISSACNTLVAVDNTLASPLIQKPLLLGANVVIESLTKILNGHTDVIGGMVATNDSSLFALIRTAQQTNGAIISPHDAGLLLRSLKTYPIRLEKQQETAIEIMSFLKTQKGIKTVFFPQLIRNQMTGHGVLVSFLLHDTFSSEKFILALRLITIAHSFGGVETVIQQPSTMMDLSLLPKTSPAHNKQFFRISIGLEDRDDILSDLKQALAAGKI